MRAAGLFHPRQATLALHFDGLSDATVPSPRGNDDRDDLPVGKRYFRHLLRIPISGFWIESQNLGLGRDHRLTLLLVLLHGVPAPTVQLVKSRRHQEENSQDQRRPKFGQKEPERVAACHEAQTSINILGSIIHVTLAGKTQRRLGEKHHQAV